MLLGDGSGAPAVPVIGGVSPARGRLGATVVPTGWHFSASRGTSLVKSGARAATRYVNRSDTRIEVKVPAGAARGKINTTVETAAGTSATTGFKRL